MIKIGMQVFVAREDAGAGSERTLHPAIVSATREGGCRIEVAPAIRVQPGDRLVLHFEDLLVFMQQAFCVDQILRSQPLELDLQAAAEPRSAEGRTSLRISTVETPLAATIGDETSCPVLDISQRGFAIRARSKLELGSRVHAVLHHGSEDLRGRAVVRSARELGEGEWRYGLLCVDGLLRFALRGVNLTVQRQALRRSREEVTRRGESDSARRTRVARANSTAGRASKAVPRLVLRFRSLLAFEHEFRNNIARGGIFIPTTAPFDRQQIIEVELDLAFCGHRIVLAAEVVSCAGPDLGVAGDAVGGAGSTVGIAVQFLESAERLRDLLQEVSGADGSLPQSVALVGVPEARRRPHQRTRTRIAAIVDALGKSRPAHTRNLSRSGALIVADGEVLPIGTPVTLTLMDPRDSHAAAVGAQVVRHVEHEGRITCMGVCFDIDPDADTPVTRFLERVLTSAHTRQLGAISGSIATVGLSNLIQMFGSCVDEGTLVLARQQEEAHVLIERGSLRHVRACGVTGLKALARLLEWNEGDFEFHPHIGAGEPESVPIPIEGALLECTVQVDELLREEAAPERTARVERCEHAAPELEASDLELQVFQQLNEGRTVQQVLDAVPAYDAEILQALAALQARKQIRISL